MGRGQDWGWWILIHSEILRFQDTTHPAYAALDLLHLASLWVKGIGALELGLVQSDFTMADMRHIGECLGLHELACLGLLGQPPTTRASDPQITADPIGLF